MQTRESPGNQTLAKNMMKMNHRTVQKLPPITARRKNLPTILPEWCLMMNPRHQVNQIKCRKRMRGRRKKSWTSFWKKHFFRDDSHLFTSSY